MRRIRRPQCICCRRVDAVYESERWPTVLLCLECIRDTATIIVRKIGVSDGNPILLELIRGLWETDGSRHRFWIRNRDNSFSECWVNETVESAMDFENPLDILHQL